VVDEAARMITFPNATAADRAAAEIELREREKLARGDVPTMFPKNDDELWEAVKYYVGIEIPRDKVCPNHVAPFTAFADAYFARSTLAIWKASRGLGGKSILLAALTFFEAISLKAYITLIGGSGEQAKRVHDYQSGDENVPGTFWDNPNAPHHLLIGDPTGYKTKLDGGGHISVLTASSKSARGPHPQRLRVDEMDEMDIVILDAALGQPMEGRDIASHTCLSSTHRYPDGTFTEMMKRYDEENGYDKGWRVFEWCYRENLGHWLTEREVSRKKSIIRANMWEVEFELQEPSSEDRAILSEHVKSTFDRSLGTFAPRNGELLIIEPPEAYGKYAIGSDWAKSVDRTITIVYRIDCFPLRLVAFRWGHRKPWPVMVGYHDKMVDLYSGAGRTVMSAHDETGLGSVIADYMKSDSFGVIMAGRARVDQLNNYISAIEGNKISSPMIKLIYSEHLYATNDDVFGTKHLPDTISAGSIAYLAFSNSGPSMDNIADLGEFEEDEIETRWDEVFIDYD
jgi:hypothetical protein